MSRETLIVGTRGSRLAVAQSEQVADLLRQANRGLAIEVRHITTQGDRQQKVALPQIGGKGLFTAEFEAALLAGTIDLAVHSAKDLPTDEPEGLSLAGVPMRQDPRDALISRGRVPLADLPEGAVVGTSSLRRQAQLRAMRPDLRFAVLRGNVDTRIRKVLDEGRCDATVLAMAGLIRAGLADSATAPFDLEDMLPAAGQGALALQARSDDRRVASLLSAIHHQPTYLALLCEREVLRQLQAGCQAPIGVHATVASSRLVCRAVVLSLDGSRLAHAAADGAPDQTGADAVGQQVVRDLRQAGVQALLDECRQDDSPQSRAL